MSLQTIIDSAQEITITRAPVVAQTLSRANYLKTATRGARIWQFTVTPSPGLLWRDHRNTIESLQYMDRYQEHTISLGNNPGMRWITRYQGDASTAHLTAMRVSSATSNTMTLSTLPNISSTAFLFKRGDFVQLSGSRYPYTVVTDLQRGTQSTATLTLNRPVLLDVTLTNPRAIVVADAVTWRVMVTRIPDIGFLPGEVIGFGGDFECVEVLQ